MLFSNREWNVKDTGYIKRGPGPNIFAKENAWVDEKGLHLSLKWKPLYSVWECSQVELTESLGYGTYTWKVEGFPTRMDESVIFGLYVYDNEAVSEDYREIDIEIGRWSDTERENSQCVIRPSNPIEGYKQMYEATQSGSYMTYQFDWQPGIITFRSWYGHDTGKEPYFEWVYEGDHVPTEGNETARMNLWLFRGAEPSNKQAHEVVIKEFEFIK